MTQFPLIVDAHLDLAYNAALGRDPRMSAREQIALPFGIASVGLPDLRAGGVDLICATIFAEPASEDRPGYRDADGAHAQFLSQLAWYRGLVDEREMQLVTCGAGVSPANLTRGQDARDTIRAQSAILLLEGADPIRSPADVQLFYNAGVRIVGLAWKRTRYAGGTGAPGPLTRDGIELVRELDRFGIIHDASHLAEESFFQLLEIGDGPVIASHSNCRAIVPGDRHLSDDMIRAIITRGGVIGMNFFDKFLLPPEERAKRRANLADVVRHVQHICDLAGNANHVGIGTDMDGGLGREQIPVEIETSADLPKLADALRRCGFDDRDTRAVMGENWMGFFKSNVPAEAGRPLGEHSSGLSASADRRNNAT